MEFVQIIEYQTSKPEEMQALGEEFQAQRAEGGGVAPSMLLVVSDRDRPDIYMTIVRFPSYDAAMENSQREDTTRMAAVRRPVRRSAHLPEPGRGHGRHSLQGLTERVTAGCVDHYPSTLGDRPSPLCQQWWSGDRFE